MVSTSLSLSVARTIVSSLDKILNIAVRGVVGQIDSGSRGLNPAFVASLPFRAALLGINFSDILVQTILETVDGSVNLALNTVQDGLDLMDTLFGPDSTSQTGETFREVWAMLSREFTQMDENGKTTTGGYPALEGMRLLMAYISIQFATSEHWETIRVRTQCRLVGECFESKDEENGSSNSWAAVGAWPEEWTNGPLALSSEEQLEQQRLVELRDHREGRSSASFYTRSPAFSPLVSSSSRTPNPELTNLLAESYRFSRFCSAMYGSTFLEIMGAPERYPPGPPGSGPSASGPSTEPPTNNTFSNETDNHFLHYTGTPLGSILYSSDTAATIHDGFYSPRYYLLDDVETKQIVLVLRGTKSLHDLMIDLTCDASDLWLDHDSTPTTFSPTVSGQNTSGHSSRQQRKKPFKVHSGFLKAARTIASADTIGIQEKIKAALEDRPGYSLLLIGHSLGAGIASILSMLWADPATGMTPEIPRHTIARSSSAAPLTDLPSGLGLSGVQWRDWNEEERRKQFLPGYSPDSNAETFLPPGRRVRCYAYGTPKVMCPRMSKRAIKLVTSISYGDDVVGRLSLGSVRNIGHAMRALLAMRPPPPASPPTTPSPPSPPVMALTTTDDDIEVLHDSEESLDELLEQEGEGFDRERWEASQQEDERSKKSKKPAYKSIGLEIVQKVIRWNLTKEEHLFEEFMDIRRAMHAEMQKHQEVEYDDEDVEMQDGFTSSSDPSSVNYSKVSPMLVPAGKVLWVRPTTLEKELENEETKQHPISSVLHQFEWDHPMDRDPGSLLIPNPISQQLHQHLEEDVSDSASVRSFKSTVRSGLYPSASSSTSPLLSSSPSMPSSPPTTSGVGHSLALPGPMSSSPPSRSNNQHKLSQPSTRQRQQSFDSVHSTAASIATTTSPASLHPGSQTTDKLLYRMYAAPNPENVFDEMLFSRRMWSDHLPLTYEFILAGKHAISVTVPHQDETSGRK
ncbi:hypothetical protein BG003_005521 [Podila horticola]|nr:hypothetical protein BG003_005521 [Podila horticola]